MSTLHPERIMMISTHGYVAAEPELGKPDTGGQVVYVLELSKCLARMGYEGEKLMRLFRDPFYKGPHSVYRAKGESFVRALVDQVSPGVE